jgi:5-phospho-D-xylono-1,4-lactonase
MSFVRTVLGDIPADQMGITYSHEHIVIDTGFATMLNPGFLLNDLSKIVPELMKVFEAGGRTMVDTMPAACGRNIMKLVAASEQSGIQIIAPTGLHLPIYYPPNHWQFLLSEEQLISLFIADIEEGIDRYDYRSPIIERSPHRAGMIKLATGDEPFDDHIHKIFRAVVHTHRRTGVPILTHTNAGLRALEQAELFAKLGADLRHVVLSHIDRNKELAYHRAVLDTGVRVEYDSAFRWKEDPNPTFTLLEKLLSEYPDQITVGMDAAKSSYWSTYGGRPGLDWLLKGFVEELSKRGLHSFFDKLFIENPQKLYSFSAPISG